MQATHKPADGEIIRRRLVVQSLQHHGGGDNRCRVDTRFQLQFEPPERFTRDNKTSVMLISRSVGSVRPEQVHSGFRARHFHDFGLAPIR